MKNKLAIIGAGGTGGHIFPALSVAEELRHLDFEILFVGIGRELEGKLIPAAGFELVTIPFVPVAGGGIRGLLRLLRRTPAALREGLRLFRARRPAVVLGFGGYPSFIPLVCAALCRVPRVLHEQNSRVGVANRVLSLIAHRVFAVSGAQGFLCSKQVAYLPNPVRTVFYEIPDLALPPADQPLVIAVLGGSQGAQRLNSAVLKLSGFFEEHSIEVMHQCGERDYSRVSELYRAYGFKPRRLAPFATDIEQYYRDAQLVICRAGALTVAELCASGRPALFVPLPIAGGHQKHNAARMVEAGAAKCIDESEDLHLRLETELTRLINSRDLIAGMGRRARALALCDRQRPAVAIARAAQDLVV